MVAVFLVKSSDTERITDFTLPLGDPDNNWKINLTISVCSKEVIPVCIEHKLGAVIVSEVCIYHIFV